MQPAVPDEPVWASADGPPVGAYRQGTPASRWALARYLVGRVIAESVSTTLYLVALALVIVAVLLQVFTHVTVLAVLVGLVALIVLFVRWVLMAVLRRLTAVNTYGPTAQRLAHLVGDTQRDVFGELRRLGLPSHRLTLPLLGFRLVGRRRKETLGLLRDFDVDRAVPAARVDELHMLLGSAFGHGAGAAR
ncbi:hypothetical protein [uncultured Jatrophihabitans sp.]|uniref:hypothetical protein n=1 Tax=uncultured Jatrophihabitans sp. TaxID=1610747 RepID=UPI0035C999B5